MKLLRAAAITVLLSTVGFSLHAQDKEFNLDETYPVEEGGTIHLSSDDADVTIKGSDRADVHLVIYRKVDVDGWKINSSGEFNVNVENRGGDLYITENSDEEFRVVMGNVDEEYRITIEAPHNAAFEIEGDDDNYSLSDIHSAIAINADDSDVEIRGAKGENFSFDIDDGSIRMDEGRGKLELKMDDGEIFVDQAEFSEIDAETDDGEIEVTTNLASEGLYLFDMDDGELELNISGGGGTFEIDHDGRNLSVGDQFEEVNAGEDESVYRLPDRDARIQIDTDDGRVELRVD